MVPSNFTYVYVQRWLQLQYSSEHYSIRTSALHQVHLRPCETYVIREFGLLSIHSRSLLSLVLHIDYYYSAVIMRRARHPLRTVSHQSRTFPFFAELQRVVCVTTHRYLQNEQTAHYERSIISRWCPRLYTSSCGMVPVLYSSLIPSLILLAGAPIKIVPLLKKKKEKKQTLL